MFEVDMESLLDGSMPPSNYMVNGAGDSVNANDVQMHTCIVCGDVSDGLHFGVYSCRACAAFFRRTVSLKLEYTCRAQSNCQIDKSARNMCRSCRYQKCLRVGMLITAVQQSRDGIGKRNTAPKTKTEKAVIRKKSDAQTPTSSTGDNWPKEDGNGSWTQRPEHDPHMMYQYPDMGQNSHSMNGELDVMSLLPQMSEGYRHFLSVRKATQSLAEDENITQIFTSQEKLRRSNFDSANRVCKVEARILTDIINNYFPPFKELPPEEKISLFKNFYSYFSSTDRAFQSYCMFGSNAYDDRILMPDGGFIRMSELEKFYENSVKCKADPKEAARIFRPAMTYIVNVIVAHMRNIQISEIEYVAILGMFLWNDALSNIQPETVQVIWNTRDGIFKDLHIYYRISGLSGAQISAKIGNLMLLLPKLQRSVLSFQENYELAELFNIFEANECCKCFRPE